MLDWSYGLLSTFRIVDSTLMAIATLGMLAVMCISTARRRRPIRHEGVHGTARFQTELEIRRGWGTSRRALFEQLDQPALGSLPPLPYEFAEWKRCRVGLDYHVEIAKHYYSVPHQLLRQEVEARITAATIEIFHRGKRVASHRRSLRPRAMTGSW